MTRRTRGISQQQLGGSLPELEFAQIRQAARPLPIQEFGTLTNVLNERFDTGLQLVEDQLEAATTFQTANLPEDRKTGELLRDDAISKLNQILEQGDFENRVVQARRLGSQFNQAAIPLIQRQEQTQEFIDSVVNDPNIIDKQRVIDAGLAKLTQDPNITEVDGRRIFGALDIEGLSGLRAGDVNVQQILQKAASGVASRLVKGGSRVRQITIDDQGNTIAILQDGTTERIDRDEMEKVLRQEVFNNPEIQALIGREEEITSLLGEENLQEQRIEDALEAVLGARSGLIKNITSEKFIPGTSTAGRGGASKMAQAIVTTGTTPGFTIRNGEGYRNLIKDINKLKSSSNPDEIRIGTQLEESKQQFDDIALGDLSNKDKQIYSAFNDIGGITINRLRQGGGELGNLDVQEEQRILDVYSSLNLGDDVKFNSSFKKLDRISDVLGRASDKIDKSLDDIGSLTREFTNYSADDEGLGKAFTGQMNDLLNKDISNQNFSAVEGYGIISGRSFNEKFKEKYIESGDFDDFSNIAFNARRSNGISLDGIPFSTVTVTGIKDNFTEQLGTELVSKSREEAWKDREKLGRALLQDGEVGEANTILQQTTRLSNGKRLGEVIAIANTAGMINNTKRDLNLGNIGTFELRKGSDGIVNLFTNKGTIARDQSGNPIDFTDDNRLLSFTHSLINSRR